MIFEKEKFDHPNSKILNNKILEPTPGGEYSSIFLES